MTLKNPAPVIVAAGLTPARRPVAVAALVAAGIGIGAARLRPSRERAAPVVGPLTARCWRAASPVGPQAAGGASLPRMAAGV